MPLNWLHKFSTLIQNHHNDFWGWNDGELFLIQPVLPSGNRCVWCSAEWWKSLLSGDVCPSDEAGMQTASVSRILSCRAQLCLWVEIKWALLLCVSVASAGWLLFHISCMHTGTQACKHQRTQILSQTMSDADDCQKEQGGVQLTWKYWIQRSDDSCNEFGIGFICPPAHWTIA